MKSKKQNNSIQKKLVRSFARVLLVTIVLSLAASEVGMFIVRDRNTQQLIEQATDSAAVYTEGKAETIGEQISGIRSKIEQIADFTEYLYRTDNYGSSGSIPTPEDFDDTVTGNQIHWLPFEKDELENPEIVGEANLLKSLEPEFEAVMSTCPMVISLYVATTSHVNIGYDQNVLAKQGCFAYNPETAGATWYQSALESGRTFISDVYSDIFDRGLMITVSVPYSVDNEKHGVIGADIIIENINKDVLNINLNDGTGYAILFSKDGAPISAKNMTSETTAASLLGGEQLANTLKTFPSGIELTEIDGKEVYVAFDTIEETGWKLALILSVDSIVAPARESGRTILIIGGILTLASILLMTVMLYAVVGKSRDLSEPVISLTEDVKKIGDGNLDYVSNIHTGDEIETLSRSFEQMTFSLKQYISNLTLVTAEKERIGAELDVAAHIQSSMLPCIFPAFPDRKEIDIFATMNPAKEVGGDFYDFFMIDRRHIAIVMADVSGKGVPAALFMVIGKTLIKDHTQAGKDLGEVFNTVNNLLCEANSEGLFITAFEGVLDIATGEFNFVNAGHEMPFICRKGGAYEPYKIKAGFVLAGMEDMRYRAGSIQLQEGDKIFQYTDGVTEATNAQNELYGMERLQAILSRHADTAPTELLPAVKADIDLFVGDAPQFDDITMLCLEFKQKMAEDDINKD